MTLFGCKMREKTLVTLFVILGEEFAVGSDSAKCLPTRLTNKIQHDGGAVYLTCVLHATLL